MDAFVAEQEAKFGGDPGTHRAEYDLLQFYDRFSLHFCMRDAESGEAAELQGYRFEPVGPWHVRLDPYPFVESPARFSLLRYVVPEEPAHERRAPPRVAQSGARRDHDRVRLIGAGRSREGSSTTLSA